MRSVNIVIAIGCVVFFFIFALWRKNVGITALDEWALLLIRGEEGSQWASFWETISWAGSTLVYASIAIVIAIILLYKKHYRAAIGLIVVFAAAYGLMVWLKEFFAFTRPAEAWGIDYSGAAFPSGHATMSSVLYGILAYCALTLLSNKKLALTISTALIVLILLIGLSRMFFQVHYLTDIITGYMLGVFCVCLFGMLFLGKKRST